VGCRENGFVDQNGKETSLMPSVNKLNIINSNTNHRLLVRYEKDGGEQYIDMPKIIIFLKITLATNASPRAELHLKFFDLIEALIGGNLFIYLFFNGLCRVSKSRLFCVDSKNIN
jgi:hypothetical protein